MYDAKYWLETRLFWLLSPFLGCKNRFPTSSLEYSKSEKLLCTRAITIGPKKVESRHRGTQVELVKKRQARVCVPSNERVFVSLYVCTSSGADLLTDGANWDGTTSIMPMCPFSTAVHLLHSVP